MGCAMKHFGLSIVVTLTCVAAAFLWGEASPGGGAAAALLVVLLGVMEVSLSFDNAVVNASVLKEMEHRWRQLFLTVGILIAVFGMRLIFPILVVTVATGQGVADVTIMALNAPDDYARHLTSAHAAIASFGGMFLLLVFLSFLLDEGRELHWLGKIEEWFSKLGNLQSIEIIFALAVLLCIQAFFPLSSESRLTVVVAGIGGVFLYVIVDSLGSYFDDTDASENVGKVAKRSGVMGFLYLEILDASFSFDGVIGAFAITRDVVIIMLGLAIGAMFVRSLTVYLVEKGTLDEYVFLEHGAHYAIGSLAFIMFGSIVWEISEIVSGLIGISFIVVAFIFSIAHKNKLEQNLSE
jgi:hypothetical protein